MNEGVIAWYSCNRRYGINEGVIAWYSSNRICVINEGVIAWYNSNRRYVIYEGVIAWYSSNRIYVIYLTSHFISKTHVISQCLCLEDFLTIVKNTTGLAHDNVTKANFLPKYFYFCQRIISGVSISVVLVFCKVQQKD